MAGRQADFRSPRHNEASDDDGERWYYFYRRPTFAYYWGGVSSWVLRPFVQGLSYGVAMYTAHHLVDYVVTRNLIYNRDKLHQQIREFRSQEPELEALMAAVAPGPSAAGESGGALPTTPAQ